MHGVAIQAQRFQFTMCRIQQRRPVFRIRHYRPACPPAGFRPDHTSNTMFRANFVQCGDQLSRHLHIVNSDGYAFSKSIFTTSDSSGAFSGAVVNWYIDSSGSLAGFSRMPPSCEMCPGWHRGCRSIFGMYNRHIELFWRSQHLHANEYPTHARAQSQGCLTHLSVQSAHHVFARRAMRHSISTFSFGDGNLPFGNQRQMLLTFQQILTLIHRARLQHGKEKSLAEIPVAQIFDIDFAGNSLAIAFQAPNPLVQKSPCPRSAQKQMTSQP